MHILAIPNTSESVRPVEFIFSYRPTFHTSSYTFNEWLQMHGIGEDITTDIFIAVCKSLKFIEPEKTWHGARKEG